MDKYGWTRNTKRSMLEKMNRKKATGSDGIVTEILSALEVFNFGKMTKVTEERYSSGHITRGRH